MKEKISIWMTLAKSVVYESLRRKDLYVIAILALIILSGAGAVGFFGVTGIEIFAKDLGFGIISLFSTLLCIMVSARQLPDEIKNRTLYPLLARPISRFDFLFGKMLGAYFVSCVALMSLVLVNGIALGYFHLSFGGILWQYILIKMMGLWVLTSLTLGLSLFTTPAANVILCLMLAGGASTLSRALSITHDSLAPAAKVTGTAIYYLIPHLDLFDLGKKVAYGWPPIPTWTIGALFIYAVLYSIVLTTIGWARFEKQAV